MIYVAISAGVGFALGRLGYRSRRRSLQNRGEALVTRSLNFQFKPPDYHLMNHVTLRLEDGTTQVDHILVSRYGVFVIETKDYAGWIFADPNQAKWTQVMFTRKYRFQNPIFQNYRHVRAVQQLLEFVPVHAIRSAVVFTGSAVFKTEIPPGVFDLPHLIEYLRTQTVEVMPIPHVHLCVGRLESNRLQISRTTDVDHAESLRQRHGNSL